MSAQNYQALQSLLLSYLESTKPSRNWLSDEQTEKNELCGNKLKAMLAQVSSPASTKTVEAVFNSLLLQNLPARLAGLFGSVLNKNALRYFNTFSSLWTTRPVLSKSAKEQYQQVLDQPNLLVSFLHTLASDTDTQTKLEVHFALVFLDERVAPIFVRLWENEQLAVDALLFPPEVRRLQTALLAVFSQDAVRPPIEQLAGFLDDFAAGEKVFFRFYLYVLLKALTSAEDRPFVLDALLGSSVPLSLLWLLGLQKDPLVDSLVLFLLKTLLVLEPTLSSLDFARAARARGNQGTAVLVERLAATPAFFGKANTFCTNDLQKTVAASLALLRDAQTPALQLQAVLALLGQLAHTPSNQILLISGEVLKELRRLFVHNLLAVRLAAGLAFKAFLDPASALVGRPGHEDSLFLLFAEQMGLLSLFADLARKEAALENRVLLVQLVLHLLTTANRAFLLQHFFQCVADWEVFFSHFLSGLTRNFAELSFRLHKELVEAFCGLMRSHRLAEETQLRKNFRIFLVKAGFLNFVIHSLEFYAKSYVCSNSFPLLVDALRICTHDFEQGTLVAKKICVNDLLAKLFECVQTDSQAVVIMLGSFDSLLTEQELHGLFVYLKNKRKLELEKWAAELDRWVEKELYENLE